MTQISVIRRGKTWWGRSVDFAKSTQQWLLHMADERKQKDHEIGSRASLIFQTHPYSPYLPERLSLIKGISLSTQGHKLAAKFSAWSCRHILHSNLSSDFIIPLKCQVPRLERRLGGLEEWLIG